MAIRSRRQQPSHGLLLRLEWGAVWSPWCLPRARRGASSPRGDLLARRPMGRTGVRPYRPRRSTDRRAAVSRMPAVPEVVVGGAPVEPASLVLPGLAGSGSMAAARPGQLPGRLSARWSYQTGAPGMVAALMAMVNAPIAPGGPTAPGVSLCLLLGRRAPRLKRLLNQAHRAVRVEDDARAAHQAVAPRAHRTRYGAAGAIRCLAGLLVAGNGAEALRPRSAGPRASGPARPHSRG